MNILQDGDIINIDVTVYLNVSVFSLGHINLSTFRIVDVFTKLNLLQSPEVIHHHSRAIMGTRRKHFFAEMLMKPVNSL
jgi:hypothetical protein